MVMDVMADFVGEHHLDFLGRELVQQGIAQQDTSRPSQASEGGVGLARLCAQV